MLRSTNLSSLPVSRDFCLFAVASAVIAAGASQVQAQALVDLQLVGPAQAIIPDQTFEVQLRATRNDPLIPASLIGMDCIIGWDPTKVQFLGISSTGAIASFFSRVPLAANDFYGINEANPPADGNLLYEFGRPLGQPHTVPSEGSQIVTFRFKSISANFTSTSVFVINNINVLYPFSTVVYSGSVPGLNVYGASTPASITQLDCSTIFWYRDSDGDGAGDPNDSTTGCTQPAGYVSSNTDLCPTNAALVAPVTYYADVDQDGFGNSASSTSVCQTSAPSGYVANSSDCDDNSVIYADGDGDGFGAGAMVACNGVATNTDCNDASTAVYPGAVENCANDGIDNDCDGEANSDAESIDSVNYYVDGDVDGFGAGAATKSCTAISGSVTNNTDCDDALKTYADGDGDTFGAGAMTACGVATNTDCADNDNTIYPGAVENCANDGIDNDCDLEANSDAEAVDSVNYYVDGDVDTYGAGSATKSCTAISGSVTNSTDCNDQNAAINPGATEICDALNTDEDCDTLADNADSSAADAGKTDFYADSDNDNYGVGSAQRFCDEPANFAPVAGDCNDQAAAINPGAQEICDTANTDEDCDTLADDNDPSATGKSTFYRDADGDTFTGSTTAQFCDVQSGYEATNEGDCDDADILVYPGAPELCANLAVDNDCDGSTAESEA